MAQNVIELALFGIEVTRNDQEVKMEFPHGSRYVEAVPGKVIFTESITSCAAIATYDHFNNSRTLCHAGGSNFVPEYFIQLAEKISSNTTIILAMGVDCNPDMFSSQSNIASWKRQLDEAMLKIGKDSGRLNWVELWQPVGQNVEKMLQLATFAMRPDGSYGLIAKD